MTASGSGNASSSPTLEIMFIRCRRISSLLVGQCISQATANRRRLAVAWLMHCPTKSEEILRQRINIISSVGLEEALPLPLAVISGEAPYNRTQPVTRAFAMLVVGQFGRAEDVDRLE